MIDHIKALLITLLAFGILVGLTALGVLFPVAFVVGVALFTFSILYGIVLDTIRGYM